MSGLPDYGIKRDYPLLWEKGEQYDISQRLGGTDNKLLAEIDAALRELWDARRYVSEEPARAVIEGRA